MDSLVDRNRTMKMTLPATYAAPAFHGSFKKSTSDFQTYFTVHKNDENEEEMLLLKQIVY